MLVEILVKCEHGRVGDEVEVSEEIAKELLNFGKACMLKQQPKPKKVKKDVAPSKDD